MNRSKPRLSTATTIRLHIECLESRTLLSFIPAVAYPTGSAATSVAAADFNNDQQVDFAVTNGGDGNVSVALGNGDGTFQPALDHFINGNSFIYAVATGDLDGDLHIDLAVARSQGGNSAGWLSVLLGNGDGTFSSPVSYAVQLGAADVALGYINGDGILDAVVSNRLSGTISVLMGDGDGTFAAAAHYLTGGTSPSGLALGDFDQTGTIDVAVANYGSDNFGLLRNQGSGTFAPPRIFASGAAGPTAIATGHFTDDNRLDLAVANRGLDSNSVSVFVGSRPGAFRLRGNLATGVATQDVTVADFDQDGLTDIASANEFSETVTIWLGNGNATFHGREDHPVGRLTFGIATGDLNGDDFPDVVTADLYGIGASILLNAADWAPAPISQPPSHEQPVVSPRRETPSVPIGSHTTSENHTPLRLTDSVKPFVSHERTEFDLFADILQSIV